MSAAVQVLHPGLPCRVIAPPTPLEVLTQAKREKAKMRMRLVEYVTELEGLKFKRGAAINLMLLRIKSGECEPHIIQAAKALGRAGKTPDRSRIYTWVKAYKEHGAQGLVDTRRGRTHKDEGWEVRAMSLYQQHAGLTIAGVARQLWQEGWASKQVTRRKVERVIGSLPADQGEFGKQRLGGLAYANTQRKPHLRDATVIDVGHGYQIDGNMMPVYVIHPVSGEPRRFELTPCIDVRSRYITGWAIGEAESAILTVNAVTDSLLRHNHVPAEIQSDKGPGFKAKMVERFFDRLGITAHKSRARNPKDNGYIERWNRTIKDELFVVLPGYTDKKKTQAHNEKLKKQIDAHKAGNSPFLTLEQLQDRLEKYIHWYNNEREHGEIGTTPVTLWKSLNRQPVINPEHVYYWHEETRKVVRGVIQFNSNRFSAPELEAHNREEVVIEYRMDSYDYIKVRTLKGEWICDAPQINRSPYRAESMIAAAIQTREKQALARLDKHTLETKKRAGKLIDHTEIMGEIVDMELQREKPALPGAGLSETSVELDILSTSYLDD